MSVKQDCLLSVELLKSGKLSFLFWDAGILLLTTIHLPVRNFDTSIGNLPCVTLSIKKTALLLSVRYFCIRSYNMNFSI